MGEPIATHTRPDQIRFKKLTIFVHNSVWLQQLTFLKPVLLQKVNTMAGESLVTEIVLRIGEFASDHVTVAEVTNQEPPPPPSVRRAAQRSDTAHERHTDQTLRDRLTAVMVQTLSQSDRPSQPPRQAP